MNCHPRNEPQQPRRRSLTTFIVKAGIQGLLLRVAAEQALEAGGARRLGNEFFFSAPQLKRDPLGG